MKIPLVVMFQIKSGTSFFFGAPSACRSLTDALPRFSPSTRPTLISIELTPSSMAPLWSIHRDPLWTQGDSAIGVTFR